jgi:hypothetical protein
VKNQVCVVSFILICFQIERTFMELIPMIRNKDPRIYDPNFKAFESGTTYSGHIILLNRVST